MDSKVRCELWRIAQEIMEEDAELLRRLAKE